MIVGHEKQLKLLEGDLVGRTLHFTGPSRIGKKWVATNLAKRLLKGEPYLHPDFVQLTPSGKLALHSADAARNLIEESRTPPHQASCRVILIDGAERMQAVSSNTLLKTLEEPLDSTLIILISQRKEQMLPTILSRCVEITFTPLKEEDILSHLPDGEGTIKKELAARFARGSLSRARDLLEKGFPPWMRPLFEILRRKHFPSYFAFREAIKAVTEPFSSWKESDEDGLRFFEEIEELLGAIAFFYRDIHLLKNGARPSLIRSPSIDLVEERRMKGDVPPLRAVLEAIEEAHFALDRSNRPSNSLEALFMKLSPPIA